MNIKTLLLISLTSLLFVNCSKAILHPQEESIQKFPRLTVAPLCEQGYDYSNTQGAFIASELKSCLLDTCKAMGIMGIVERQPNAFKKNLLVEQGYAKNNTVNPMKAATLDNIYGARYIMTGDYKFLDEGPAQYGTTTRVTLILSVVIINVENSSIEWANRTEISVNNYYRTGTNKEKTVQSKLIQKACLEVLKPFYEYWEKI